MKFLLSIILILSSSFAHCEPHSTIFPHFFNYGDRVEVKIWNHLDQSVRCSGHVFMWLDNGESDQSYFFEIVPSRFTVFRSFYPRFTDSKIRRVGHSIFCH